MFFKGQLNRHLLSQSALICETIAQTVGTDVMFPSDSVSMQKDYYYEYTECDSTGTRWRVAIPQVPGDCVGLPEPVRGTECSKCPFSLSAGWNLQPDCV